MSFKRYVCSCRTGFSINSSYKLKQKSEHYVPLSSVLSAALSVPNVLFNTYFVLPNLFIMQPVHPQLLCEGRCSAPWLYVVWMHAFQVVWRANTRYPLFHFKNGKDRETSQTKSQSAKIYAQVPVQVCEEKGPMFLESSSISHGIVFVYSCCTFLLQVVTCQHS